MNQILARWVNAWLFFLILGAPFFYFFSEILTIGFCQCCGLVMLILLLYSPFLHLGNNRSKWFFRVTLLWLVLSGISTLFSVDPSVSIPGFIKLIGLVIIAATVRYSLDEPSAPATMMIAAGIAGLLHGAIGIPEYLRGDPMPLSWIDPTLREIIKSRSAGMFGDPNIYGVYLASLLPFQVAGLFKLASHPLHTAFWGASVFVTTLGIFTSFSRGAYLAIVGGGLVLLFLLKPTWNASGTKKFLLGLIVVLLAVFLIGPFKLRLLSSFQPKDMTLSQRTLINKGLYQAIPQVPILGFGLHTFNQVYPRFRLVGGDYPMNAHNELLQTWMEAGPMTALALLAICILLFRQMYVLVRLSPGQVSWIAAACSASFTVFFIQNFSGFSTRIYPTALLMACTVGGILNLMREPNKSPQLWFQEYIPRPAWITFLAVFFIFTVKFMFVQYLLQDARLCLAQRNYIFAESSLRGIETVDTRNPVAHFLMAQVDEINGRIASAEMRLKRAIELNSTEAIYWVEYSKFAGRHSLEGVRDFMAHAVELDPASEYFRMDYARLLASAGRTLEAIAQLDAALKYSPGFHETYPAYFEVEKLRRLLASQTTELPK